METESYVLLNISSDALSVDEMTALIGVKPDNAIAKGDSIQRTLLKARRHRWQIGSGKDASTNMVEQIHALSERVAGSESRIRKLADENIVQLACVVYSARYNWSEELDRKCLRLLENLDATLYLDIYKFEDIES